MKQCFVISPIGEEGSDTRKHSDDVFEYVIRPAMSECGIEAFRSDHLEKPGRITEQMFRSICEADLCVAVLTGYNPNVFYELAIAQAARRPVVILIQKGHPLPFDVADLRCVTYDLEIRSYSEKTHINTIISYIRGYEECRWQVADLIGPYRLPDAGPDLEFFEYSGNFGKDRDWLALLEGATQSFDMMGFALTGWRKTHGFRKIVMEKAKTGCRFRMLLMDGDNPVLRGLVYPSEGEYSFDGLLHDIEQSTQYYRGIAREFANVQVRQIYHGLPHFFLTRCDAHAIVIQYLTSQSWGTGPLWHCNEAHPLYKIAQQEFDALWEANDPARKEKLH